MVFGPLKIFIVLISIYSHAIAGYFFLLLGFSYAPGALTFKSKAFIGEGFGGDAVTASETAVHVVITADQNSATGIPTPEIHASAVMSEVPRIPVLPETLNGDGSIRESRLSMVPSAFKTNSAEGCHFHFRSLIPELKNWWWSCRS
jgi:hypothetical protein